MNKHFLVLLSLSLLLWSGCSQSHVQKPQELKNKKVVDLEFYPQFTQAYADNIHEHKQLLKSQEGYEKKYFEPWVYAKPPFEVRSIMWPFRSYTADKSYGENLKKLPQSWFDEMLEKSNFKAYGSLNKKAMTLHYTDVRNFPTHKPVLKDPSIAGEGYPFDYMQNSGIHANEPLFVSHLSRDGEWAYIFTSYITGWVRLRDIVYVSESISNKYMQARFLSITDEQYPIKDLQGNFVFKSRVGMRLPLVSIEKEYFIALALKEGKNHRPTYVKVRIPFQVGQEGIISLTPNNLVHISDLMLMSKYGWGGLYEERDCSSMLRDLYAPFGIWLPRNSSQQAKIGKVISFEGLNLEQKREKIKKEGIAFETLLYKKGHILLYLGLYKGKIAVLHNAWGIRTLDNGKEGRKILGKTIISSLELGKELKDYDKDSGLLAKIKSMNIITQE